MPTFSSMHQRDARMFVPCRNCASLSSLMGRPMCQSILADCGWLWYFDDFDDLMFDYMLKWPKSIGLKLSNRCWTLLHVSAYSAACCQQQRNSKKTGTNMRGVLSVLPLPRWNLTSSVQSVLPSIIRNGSGLAWEVPWQPQFYWPQFILEYLTLKLLKGPFHVFFSAALEAFAKSSILAKSEHSLRYSMG